MRYSHKETSPINLITSFKMYQSYSYKFSRTCDENSFQNLWSNRFLQICVIIRPTEKLQKIKHVNLDNHLMMMKTSGTGAA